MANDLQRTQEWHLTRKGKITASECYVLLNNRKESMSEEELAAWKEANPKSRMTTKEVPFSTGTFTYLDGKVAEMYMTDASYLEYIEQANYETRAMQWGSYWESEARDVYSRYTECSVVDAPFIPLAGFEKFAGGSPDGILDGDDGIIEIKCPFNPAVHLRHFLYEKPEDLYADNAQYYIQCQYNMLCTELSEEREIKFCDFISYDPRTSASKQLKVLRIPKDEQLHEMLIQRTRLAVEYIREKIDMINSVEPIIK